MSGFLSRKISQITDVKRTSNQCLEVWHVINQNDKNKSAENILKTSRYFCAELSNAEEVTAKLSQFKQVIITQYKLKNHMHPAFMQLQILMDLVFAGSQDDESNFKYTLAAFREITSPLVESEKLELETNLVKFIKNKNFKSYLVGGEPFIAKKEVTVAAAIDEHSVHAPNDDTRSATFDESIFWEQALDEYEQQIYPRGLWAKCYAEADGHEAKAKAIFLRLRTAELTSMNLARRPNANEVNTSPKIEATSAIVKIPNIKSEVLATSRNIMADSSMSNGNDKPENLSEGLSKTIQHKLTVFAWLVIFGLFLLALLH